MYTEKRGERAARWINAVAGKLGAEGMARTAYNRDKAKAILAKGIMPKLLIETLIKYELEIKERLQ